MTPALRTLSEAELLDWLQLVRSENVGPRTFMSLMARFGDARAALDALPRLSARGAGRALKVAPLASIEAEFDRARRGGLRFLPLCDPAYPPSLRAIPAAPPVIAVRGQLAILQRPMVAIVGSRNASAAGLVFTDRLAIGLGQAGFAVVSGLARGIDARAHTASLATGTVAVLAGGHDRIYPSEHRGLVERIAETGAVLSEMPIAWEPRGNDFPRRNRIVSGLAYGVVVVEAARRSGSLITARFAAEQGREVFAVPGSPLDLRAEGTNDLLRGGATFCTGPEDVVSELLPVVSRPLSFDAREPDGGDAPDEAVWDEADVDLPWRRDDVAASPARLPTDDKDGDPSSSDAERVAALIGASPIGIDDLARAAELPVRVVQGVIVELELDGRARRGEDGGIAMVPR